MRKISTLILILLSAYCFSQTPKRVNIDKRLVEYVEDYIDQAQERGFYVRGLIVKRIDYIYIIDSIGTDERDHTQIIGSVGNDRRGFVIAEEVLKDTILTRVTVYHEIGHILAKSSKHVVRDKYHIMSSTHPEDDNILRDKIIMNGLIDEYFKWLSQNYKE